ncbi:PBP1A family penicillin-binding protein [Candidatus Pacebacteria bacterium]|nr:PBP1A family penicillin-binding protein [Candidatus Paceibacterota bacterium]
MNKLYNRIIRFIDRSLEKIDLFVDWGGKKTEKTIDRTEKTVVTATKKTKYGIIKTIQHTKEGVVDAAQITKENVTKTKHKTKETMADTVKNTKAKIIRMGVKKFIWLCVIGALILGGIIFIWVSTFELPDLENFEERQIAQSTKIYDRTGDVVLFDVHGEVTRTVVPFDQISDHVKWATIAIEDSNFYNHNGIEPQAILRAIFVNLKDGDLLGGQGGSTITQQVIKNSLLTSDKKVSRKVKEWVLAPRLESKLTKDEILEVYLNEVPYGGTVYGIQEASRRFFSKDAKDLTLAESAYLAALPQAPTYFSPFGNNTDRLEARKTKVLNEMLSNNFITQTEYNQATKEEVTFEKPENFGIKAPHFVFWIREQLEERYGSEAVEQGGLKVITTLDWELQEPAEEIVKRKSLENKETFDAENGAIVAVEPKTGQILTMVGSRDYFDEDIEGNFNIATAERQPGSAFKPFVYAAAFDKGYRPETVVFDLPTEFSTTCSDPGGNCYNPVNYDNAFRGPMSLRDALAQSVNIPAVKALYLAGLKDSLELAKKFGLETLTNTDQYGLTLVLGGGEVRPLDMAAAYGVFANDGIKYETTGILRIEDRNGNVLEEYEESSSRVLPEQTAKLISDVLSDNIARTPAFGANSFLHFPGTDVAAKTGTTNDYRDAWIVGYTPAISVAAWAGNNDNRSMDKKVAGFIIAPMWNEFMQVAIEKYPGGNFNEPDPITPGTKAILAGFWKGETTKMIDSTTGEEVTKDTNPSDVQTVVSGAGGGVHSILHWVDKDNPIGPVPRNPSRDPQYENWERSVNAWANRQGFTGDFFDNEGGDEIQSTDFRIINPSNGDVFVGNLEVYVAVTLTGSNLAGGDVYINGLNVGPIEPVTNSFSFVPNDINEIKNSGNILRVVAKDGLGNEFEDEVTFGVR